MLHIASNIELAFCFVQKSSKSHIKTDLLTTTTFAFAATNTTFKLALNLTKAAERREKKRPKPTKRIK